MADFFGAVTSTRFKADGLLLLFANSVLPDPIAQYMHDAHTAAAFLGAGHRRCDQSAANRLT
jgi:hypothetical protein